MSGVSFETARGRPLGPPHKLRLRFGGSQPGPARHAGSAFVHGRVSTECRAMKPAAIMSLIAAGFMLALAQTLGTMAGTTPAIIVGVADGVLVLPLFQLFRLAWD